MPQISYIPTELTDDEREVLAAATAIVACGAPATYTQIDQFLEGRYPAKQLKALIQRLVEVGMFRQKRLSAEQRKAATRFNLERVKLNETASTSANEKLLDALQLTD